MVMRHYSIRTLSPETSDGLVIEINDMGNRWINWSITHAFVIKSPLTLCTLKLSEVPAGQTVHFITSAFEGRHVQMWREESRSMCFLCLPVTFSRHKTQQWYFHGFFEFLRRNTEPSVATKSPQNFPLMSEMQGVLGITFSTFAIGPYFFQCLTICLLFSSLN